MSESPCPLPLRHSSLSQYDLRKVISRIRFPAMVILAQTSRLGRDAVSSMAPQKFFEWLRAHRKEKELVQALLSSGVDLKRESLPLTLESLESAELETQWVVESYDFLIRKGLLRGEMDGQTLLDYSKEKIKHERILEQCREYKSMWHVLHP